MLKIDNLVTPSPELWQAVIKGMRLPFKSGDRSDSEIKLPELVDVEKDCLNCTSYYAQGKCYQAPGTLCGLIIGEKDKNLLLNLCREGHSSHRKLLRQLPVVCNITAPLYLWKQLDQFKVGTVTNSESTIHTITKHHFKPEDFSIENFCSISYEETNGLDTFGDEDDGDYAFDGLVINDDGKDPEEFFTEMIANLLNSLRLFYLKTKDMKYWYALHEILPQSYNQKRCWSGNYEILVNIIEQRTGHPLKEWKTFIDYMLENVPYLREIIEAINENRTQV